MTTSSKIEELVEKLRLDLSRLRDSQTLTSHPEMIEVDLEALCGVLLEAHEAADLLTHLKSVLEENENLRAQVNRLRNLIGAAPLSQTPEHSIRSNPDGE